MTKPTMSTTQKQNPVADFNIRYWMLFVFISLVYVAIGKQLWERSSEISSALNVLKFSNVEIRGWLASNWEGIVAATALYITALAFWKFRKGIFSESEFRMKFWSGMLLHRMFNLALLAPYMLYLCHKTLPDRFLWIWILMYFASYILASSLIEVKSDQRNAALDRRWIVWILLFLTVAFIVASFALDGFWEAAIVLFVSGVAFPASNSLLRSYTASISSYSAIERVHALQADYGKNVKDGMIAKRIREFLFDEDGKTVENPVSLPFAFESLETLGNMCLVAAFGFVYVGWSHDLNLITVVYVHVTLVLCALHLWLIANKFPPKIDICANWKWKKGLYLAERSEQQIVVMDKKGRSIFRPDDVSEIRIASKTAAEKIYQ